MNSVFLFVIGMMFGSFLSLLLLCIFYIGKQKNMEIKN